MDEAASARRTKASFVLAIFLIGFAIAAFLLPQDDAARRSRRTGSGGGEGTATTGSPLATLDTASTARLAPERPLWAHGSVLDEVTVEPVAGARVALVLRLPLERARDPRAREVLERGRLPAPSGPLAVSRDGLELAFLGYAVSGADGEFVMALAWPQTDLGAVAWALRREGNRFEASARVEGGTRAAARRAVEPEAFGPEGVLEIGALVVRATPGALTVRVLESGKEVEGARVALADSPGEPEVATQFLTGKDGKVECFPQQAKLAVTVRRPGFVTEERLVSADVPGGAFETFALLPEAPLAGMVADTSGKPVAGALVLAGEAGLQESKPALSVARTGEDGRFRLSGLRAGKRHALRALPPSAALAEATVEASAGGEDARIVLERSARLEVEVAFPKGSRPSRLSLEALRKEERGEWRSVARETETARTEVGHVVFPVLVPGAYRVRYSPFSGEGNDGDCAEAVSSPVEVQGGETARASLDLTRTRVVTGRVVDTRGAPVAGATVLVEHGLHSARSVEDGRFQLTAVASAEVWLVARAEGFEEQRRLVGAADAVVSPDFQLVPAPPPIERPR